VAPFKRWGPTDREDQVATAATGAYRLTSLDLAVAADMEPFAFAALWEFARLDGEEILSATIIVGEPNPLLDGIHDRMPVMLLPDDYDRCRSGDDDR
jgi:putative SOS response-associated peptidase YedK